MYFYHRVSAKARGGRENSNSPLACLSLKHQQNSIVFKFIITFFFFFCLFQFSCVFITIYIFNITVKEVYVVKENRMRVKFITDNFSFATSTIIFANDSRFFFIESKIIFHKRNKILLSFSYFEGRDLQICHGKTKK